MNISKKLLLRAFVLSLLGSIIYCSVREDGEEFTPEVIIFEDKSDTPPLVTIAPQFNFVEAYSLISTTDVIGGGEPASLNGFQLAGTADGAGFLVDDDGYIYVVNCEDSYAVARVRLDANLNPISGDYLLNSSVGDFARQCSGTMWEAEIHGGTADIFLSASESIHYDVKAIDPRVGTPTPSADFGMDALGEFSWENAVPLPKDAYTGRTVILGGDDDSSDSEGQVTLYYSENGDADFDSGKIYVLQLKQVSDGTGGVMDAAPDTSYSEADLDFGVEYDVEFIEIPNGKDLTKDEMEIECMAFYASRFMRVEDLDYQKGSDANGRNIFFAVTGRGPGRGTYNDWGTVYNLKLDDSSPLTGKLTQIVSGNTDTNNSDGNLAMLQSPDNICVTDNFVYIQEDPNSFERGHSAYIYQTDLDGNNAKVVLEFVVRQDLAEGGSTKLSGEYGSMIDISDKIGVDNVFILALQPHYWRDDAFKSLDGHDNSAFFEDDQASQIILLKGLPR